MKLEGADNKTKIGKIILIWLLLISPILYNIFIKIFKIMWTKGALLIKRNFGNKWFFNFKDRHYIIGCKDWLINFKKFLSEHLMDIVTREVIEIEKINNI